MGWSLRPGVRRPLAELRAMRDRIAHRGPDDRGELALADHGVAFADLFPDPARRPGDSVGRLGERQRQARIRFLDQRRIAVGLGQTVEEVGEGDVARECDPETLELIHVPLLPR